MIQKHRSQLLFHLTTEKKCSYSKPARALGKIPSLNTSRVGDTSLRAYMYRTGTVLEDTIFELNV